MGTCFARKQITPNPKKMARLIKIFQGNKNKTLGLVKEVGKWNCTRKEVFLNLDKCRALFKTWLLVAQDLWWDKEARKSIYVNWASVYCIKIIFQVRGAPCRKDASSQDCRSLSCKDSETRIMNKPFFDPAVCEKTAMRLDMNLWII